jgi:hypothetical protein
MSNMQRSTWGDEEAPEYLAKPAFALDEGPLSPVLQAYALFISGIKETPRKVDFCPPGFYNHPLFLRRRGS